MPLNEFAPFIKQHGCFIVKNIAPSKKTLFIFNEPIPWDYERDLLMAEGIGEADIRASLLKGELNLKLRAQEITITCSDIDLLQFNDDQKTFLKNSGVVNGLEIAGTSIVRRDDIQLIGSVDNANTVYATPEVFLFDATHKIIVYRNGVKQVYLDDFYIAEGGGVGTGYNRVIFNAPPVNDGSIFDILTADYYVNTG